MALLFGQLTHFEQAKAFLARLQASVQAVGDTTIAIGTDVIYAWGQEFGYYRNDKLARRDGGRFYLTASFEELAPTLPARLAEALPNGPESAVGAVEAVAGDIAVLAQQRAPVLTGNLRASIHLEMGPRSRVA